MIAVMSSVLQIHNHFFKPQRFREYGLDRAHQAALSLPMMFRGPYFFSWRRLIAREMAAHEVAIIPFLICLKNADGVPLLLTVYFSFTTKSLNGF